MDKERNYLVEWVFPRIKELCAERGVEFLPIDLRWGITEEEGKKGKIINACFEEIDNSRPFFIGLIGDRYGWQPTIADLGKSAPVLLERYPWLLKDIQDGLSITEMEMQYGALRQEEIEAAFYIREIPKESISQPNTSNDHPHLARLKDSIVKNKHVHSSLYTTLEQLGNMVYNDLKAVIDAEFPIDKDQRQLNKHDRSFRSHLTNYVDLSHYHRQLEEALDKLNKEHRFLAIHGLKGAGKSTVLCTFIDQYRKTHETACVLYFDIAKLFLDRDVYWRPKSRVFPKGWITYGGAGLNITFLTAINNTLKRTGATDKIVALDNLEYLSPEQHKNFIHYLLYLSTLNLDTKIIITHTDYEFNPYHTSEEDMTYSYISIENLKAEKVEVHGIPRENIPIFVKRYLKQFGKSLTPQQLEQFKTPHYTENPHYLIMALYQLVKFGSFEKLQKELDYLTENSDYEKWMREKSLFNYICSISTPVTYTLDNVICRELDDEGKKNIANLVFFALFICNRAGIGLTEQEIIGIFSLNPAQWALLRPQVMLICRVQNNEITFNDNMFVYIQGHTSSENIDMTIDTFIQYFEQIPWQYELEEEWSAIDKRFLSEADKVRAKKSFRKAQVLPICLFQSKKYLQLQAYLNDSKIRKNIPRADVEWLEKRLQEKLDTSK